MCRYVPSYSEMQSISNTSQWDKNMKKTKYLEGGNNIDFTY